MENQKIENLLRFNSQPSTVMHIDLNSCFATIEQQANPLLRGKPLAVAAFATNKGCILAASIEAKKLGIKTGMRVMDGRAIYPKLIVLPPDPWKYRNVHLKLRNLISGFTSDFAPKSIDEFVLNMKDTVKLREPENSENSESQKIRLSEKQNLRNSEYSELSDSPMHSIAKEIKARIKEEIGEWLTVSVGIAPNRYLAKIAAGLHKPDGLDEINAKNFLDIYSTLKLTDLTGIKERNAARLNSMGIYSVLDFYGAPIWKLKAAFHSITGLYWHARMHGYEVDDVEYGRRSYGNSVAIGKNLSKIEELSPILARLTEKMCSRLRAAHSRAAGVHLTISYKNGSWWHKGRLLSSPQFDSRDFYKAAFRLLLEARPASPVLNLAVSVYGLSRDDSFQLNFFDDVIAKRNLVKAVDGVNERFGDFTVFSGRSMGGAKVVMDRIAFGGVKELVTDP